jgi:hypothetical protein
MPPSAKEFNKLLNETKKANDSLYKVLDFVDLINNNLEYLSPDVVTWGNEIRVHASEIEKHIEEIKGQVNAVLDTIPIDPVEVKDAAEKLLLYQGDATHVLFYSDGQKRNHKENSYWWRYWQAVYDIVKEKKG